MSTLKEKIEQAKDRIKRKQKVATATVATAAAVVVGAGAPTTEANAQSAGFKLEPIQTPIQQAPQQSNQDGKTISFQQAQRQVNSPEQRLWASLPPYTQEQISNLRTKYPNLKILTEYNKSLNRPEAGIIYACAVADPTIPGNVLFIPVAEVLYKAGANNPTKIYALSIPENHANQLMTGKKVVEEKVLVGNKTKMKKTSYSKENNPYAAHTEFMITLANGVRALRTQNRLDDQYAREKTRAATSEVRHANDRVREINKEARRARQNVENARREYNNWMKIIYGKNKKR